MSVRRAIELNLVQRLSTALANSKYKVVESSATDERPLPCVIVMAGNADNQFEGMPQAYGNFAVDLSIVLMTSVDTGTIDEHNDATQIVMNAMNLRSVRKESVVDGLHLYDIVSLNAGEGNQDRKLGSGLNYKAIVNYTPATPS